MKYGAPKTAVITPTGTSEGAIIVLLMESQKYLSCCFNGVTITQVLDYRTCLSLFGRTEFSEVTRVL